MLYFHLEPYSFKSLVQDISGVSVGFKNKHKIHSYFLISLNQCILVLMVFTGVTRLCSFI